MIGDGYIDGLIDRVYELNPALARELERAIETYVDNERHEAMLDGEHAAYYASESLS